MCDIILLHTGISWPSRLTIVLIMTPEHSSPITIRYNVDGFDGKKSLVISTRGDLGPNNYNLGVVFLVLGSVTLFMSIVFFLKQQFAPRALGTPTILNWKSD